MLFIQKIRASFNQKNTLDILFFNKMESVFFMYDFDDQIEKMIEGNLKLKSRTFHRIHIVFRSKCMTQKHAYDCN